MSTCVTNMFTCVTNMLFYNCNKYLIYTWEEPTREGILWYRNRTDVGHPLVVQDGIIIWQGDNERRRYKERGEFLPYIPVFQFLTLFFVVSDKFYSVCQHLCHLILLLIHESLYLLNQELNIFLFLKKIRCVTLINTIHSCNTATYWTKLYFGDK